MQASYAIRARARRRARARLRREAILGRILAGKQDFDRLYLCAMLPPESADGTDAPQQGRSSVPEEAGTCISNRGIRTMNGLP